MQDSSEDPRTWFVGDPPDYYAIRGNPFRIAGDKAREIWALIQDMSVPVEEKDRRLAKIKLTRNIALM